MLSPHERLIVALDTHNMDQVDQLLSDLDGLVNFYKIGMELVYSGAGLALAERLIRRNIKVFMDLKLLDIENTVERATSEIVNLGATFLTVHGYPRAIEAAVKGTIGSDLRILVVSVLTSYDDKDLRNAWYQTDVNTLVFNRTKQAKDLGAGGVILSPLEVSLVRSMQSDTFSLVTPGIRLLDGKVHDQKRIATPKQAIDSGADYIVVGRPITESYNPREVVTNILNNIKGE
jgi:orotidine-5'-phosphate decarboxylase